MMLINLLSNSKFCKKCGLVKPVKHFYYKKRLGRYDCTCKECFSVYTKNWHINNKEFSLKISRNWRMNNRKRHLDLSQEHNWKSRGIKKYNNSRFTVEDYKKLVAVAGNKCMICLKEKVSKLRWNVDHDHKTGLVRGVICSRCNNALEIIDGKDDVLNRFEKYLCGELFDIKEILK